MNYVLQDFAKAERDGWLADLLPALADEAATLIAGDSGRVMTGWPRGVPPPPKAATPPAEDGGRRGRTGRRGAGRANHLGRRSGIAARQRAAQETKWVKLGISARTSANRPFSTLTATAAAEAANYPFHD